MDKTKLNELVRRKNNGEFEPIIADLIEIVDTIVQTRGSLNGTVGRYEFDQLKQDVSEIKRRL